MTEFLADNHLQGLAVGLGTFLIIGVFHPLVIKGYYHFGIGVRWAFLVAGFAFAAASIIAPGLIASTLLGVASFSSFWGILEVHEQRKRVAKGWFPANPKHKHQS